MKLSKTPLRTVLLVLLLTGAAAAAPVRWYLKDVTFSDGGSANGYFTLEGGGPYNGPFIDYNIITTSGTVLSGQQYDSLTDPNPTFNAGFGGPSGNVVIFRLDISRALTLTADRNLTRNTGLAPLLSGQQNNSPLTRTLVSGYFTTDSPAVPEPTSLLLAGLGCAGFLAARARRRS